MKTGKLYPENMTPEKVVETDATGLAVATRDISDQVTGNANDIIDRSVVEALILVEDLWDRAGAVLSPKTAGDSLSIDAAFVANTDFGDNDFTINKQTSGTAMFYDASLDTLALDTDVTITGITELAKDATGHVSLFEDHASGISQELRIHGGTSGEYSVLTHSDDVTDYLELTNAAGFKIFGAFWTTGNALVEGTAQVDDYIKTAGSARRKTVIKTANYTALGTDHRIIGKTNAFTVTLPAAATYWDAATDTGIEYTIKNDSGNTGNDVTVDGDGAELIEETATKVLAPGDSMTIITDGTKWHVI